MNHFSCLTLTVSRARPLPSTHHSACRPTVGPQGALGGPAREKSQTCGWRSGRPAAALTSHKTNRASAQLAACDAAARSATATPRLPGRPPPRPVAVHHEMDDGDLPPVPLLPLSRPAAQALNDNPDAPLSPESTGGDGSQASDIGVFWRRISWPRVGAPLGLAAHSN